ncbi:Do family serine endopeptidase [Commensalibacter nepenthis]|uniref:Probable periplasmic serine endoprotease DegP-like n=1 Tax=Commensalibacter nepenthis TaxID=3043872 RepID=A0ABT6Q8P0_9PROT|nr:Do family serine endopeptidase [Commensalibacter sp. TBRC 10068]MDI2113270.1 Do family serine endopeptidase [Commensalibacter sp. TBRC 10068]
MKIRTRFLIQPCCLLFMGTTCLFPVSESKAQSSFFSFPLFHKAVQVGHSQRVPESFADLAEKLLPTVVNISSSKVLKPGQTTDDDEDEDSDEGDDESNAAPDPNSPFEKFFRNYMNNRGIPDDGNNHLQALGSGFVVDPAGWIVTNYHVIKDADQITVTLQNNHMLKATLKGVDERTDLALLKINPKTPLTATSFGNSDQSRVGDWVLAIGNPYGLSGTVTSGIISSRGRDIEQGPYDDFIQTDAPINKGNSGGPLFNMKGEVVGINTAIFSPSGGSIGIAFAIPSNEAKGIIDQLKKSGKVARGWVGIRIQEVSETIADSLNIQPFQGALVVQVDPNGPAAKAGIKAGDVIQTLDGNNVTAHTMPRLVAQMAAETKATIGILRQGKKLDLPILIASLPDDGAAQPDTHHDAQNEKEKIFLLKDLGVSVSNMTDLLRQKYNLSEKQQGVIIVGIDSRKGKNQSDLKVGDVIIGTNKSNITQTAELQKEITLFKQEAKKKNQQKPTMLLLIQSGNAMRWIAVPVKDSKK